MKKTLTRWDLIVASLLALGHVSLYIIDVTMNSDGNGWPGFLVFMADLPISILLGYLSRALSLNGWILLLAGGTVWWFGLGILISMLTKRIYRLAIRLGSV